MLVCYPTGLLTTSPASLPLTEELAGNEGLIIIRGVLPKKQFANNKFLFYELLY